MLNLHMFKIIFISRKIIINVFNRYKKQFSISVQNILFKNLFINISNNKTYSISRASFTNVRFFEHILLIHLFKTINTFTPNYKLTAFLELVSVISGFSSIEVTFLSSPSTSNIPCLLTSDKNKIIFNIFSLN